MAHVRNLDRLLCIAGLCAAAFVGVSSAQGAADRFARLLAPPGFCGPAAEELGLNQAAAARTMLCLTNYARTQSGIRPLTANALLDQAGQAKLRADLACGEFSHSPCGRPYTRIFSAYLEGASRYLIGENIAWATGLFGTPRQTMDAWLHSPDHRENILNPRFRAIGIGYLSDQTFRGHGGATLWSQEFGARAAR